MLHSLLSYSQWQVCLWSVVGFGKAKNTKNWTGTLLTVLDFSVRNIGSYAYSNSIQSDNGRAEIERHFTT